MRPRNRNHRAQSSRQLDSGSSHAGSTRRDTALRRVESSVSIIRDRDVVAHQRGAAEMPASARPGPAPRTGTPSQQPASHPQHSTGRPGRAPAAACSLNKFP